ncbi:oxytocin receptor isoform X2 [Neophocaena asiaeorientalis asiaeorientalis]|uniref:Oxytocin receptor isoform X2 n=1 Tax=Neophocaena asiaeorientalis asiaeorientalis TaxID=1706337 RepID=A0A341B4D0_NEOAA|nr:oxytocin receptor isoform X2 [Neophocaena asiaeorientalis asiaeorientalis]
MDLSFEAESPLAPPAELLERLPSCDCLLQGDRCCQSWNPGCQIFFPPSEAPGRPQEQRCWSSFLEHRVPVVTEEVAREALLSFVDSKCCYGSAAAGDLVILELKQQVLRRYRLETFSESRISEWTFQPFTNHSVDGPQRGTSPKLWDIKVQVPPMFQEDTRKFQVPHSSLVKECHKCHGHGRYKCSSCHGAGTVRCPSCSRAKRRARPARRCQMCSGSGRQRCSTCSGRGNKTCATCKGEKKLLHFLQLVIVWYVAPLNAMAWRGGRGGRGLDWFLQRSSTWLGLSQCRDLLGETESQGPKAPHQGSSHALRVSPIGYLARTELSVLY